MNKEEIAEVARVAAQEVLARKDAIIDEELTPDTTTLIC